MYKKIIIQQYHCYDSTPKQFANLKKKKTSLKEDTSYFVCL